MGYSRFTRFWNILREVLIQILIFFAGQKNFCMNWQNQGRLILEGLTSLNPLTTNVSLI